MNVRIKQTVSDNAYVFALFTDETLSGANLTSRDNVVALALFDASTMVKGSSVSLAISPGALLERYIQAGVGSLTSIGDEAGRFDIDPVNSRFFVEARR